MLLIILLLVLVIIVFILDKAKELATKDNNRLDEKIPYKKAYFLTKNEYAFYKSLQPIAEKYGYCVLAKIRLADLVEVNSEVTKNERSKYFAKIKSKHIDFALCNKKNLYPELLIELQDNSHKNAKRIERDEFVKRVTEKVGYKIIFVYSTSQLIEETEKIFNDMDYVNQSTKPTKHI